MESNPSPYGCEHAGDPVDRTHVAGLDEVLADEGWPYASSPPVEPGDPGRFHALFGRDSLITSLQVLPARPDVARATLRALARLQGARADEVTEEEPGKIGHEFRPSPPPSFVEAGWRGTGAFRYYGTADATSWFCVLLAATGDAALAGELRPAWTAAGAWLERSLERGGGLLRHAPSRFPGGLTQQGWRDTIDPASRSGHGGGILRPDGTPPTPPLADADTQAVTVAALRALAGLSGDGRWTELARELRRRVTAQFGPEVMAIEADDRAVAGPGSQLGWLLWADALEPDAAAATAERLTQPDILTPWGLRTLASTAPTYEPHAYHRGSIWPFDSWIGWGGLRAAGRTQEAECVRTGVLAALEQLGRAPELYAVADDQVQPIAMSNRVQAWTVGARWALANRWDGRA
jgi:glycogen debranching enzyme